MLGLVEFVAEIGATKEAKGEPGSAASALAKLHSFEKQSLRGGERIKPR